jgi:hypothetical protein
MQAQNIQLLSSNAPAALAFTPDERVSKTYSFLSTRAVVEALAQDGWGVADAEQGQSRRSGGAMSAKHRVILADADLLKNGRLGIFAETPRIILTNSHDGGAKFTLQAGMFVTACFNGLYVSQGLVQAVGIRHSRRTTEEVVTAAQTFRAEADRIAEHVAKFKAKELSPAAAVEFARLAIQLRHSGDSGVLVAMDDILRPQRAADAGTSLWKVFNRTQENLIKGGYPLYTREQYSWSERAAKPIKALDRSAKVNTALWALAEEFVHGAN